MKTHACACLILLAAVLGCNLFSKNSANNPPAANTNNTAASASPTPEEISQEDFVGRWAVKRDYKDHIIELRPDGTGTITLDEHGKTEAKQDFSWKFSNKAVTFTITKPAVDPKSTEAGGLTIRGELVAAGTKLKTDYSPYTRTRGEDTWDKK